VRFFVLQNGLESLATHYFNETLGWRDVCAQQGIACRIYANRKAGPEITGPLDAVPTFTFAADDGLRFEPATQALHDMVVKCDFFAHECRLLDAHGAGHDDVVIVPYAGAAEMVGLSRWLENRKREERPRIVTIMHRQGDDWRLDSARTAVVEGDTAPLRYGAQRLVRAAGEGRLLFAANSTTLARLLANVTGIATTALPVLLRHGLAAHYGGRQGDAAMPDYRGHRFDVGLLGEFRAEKGGKTALKALARCFGERTGLTAAVQVADDAGPAAGRARIRRHRRGEGPALAGGFRDLCRRLPPDRPALSSRTLRRARLGPVRRGDRLGPTGGRPGGHLDERHDRRGPRRGNLFREAHARCRPRRAAARARRPARPDGSLARARTGVAPERMHRGRHRPHRRLGGCGLS